MPVAPGWQSGQLLIGLSGAPRQYQVGQFPAWPTNMCLFMHLSVLFILLPLDLHNIYTPPQANILAAADRLFYISPPQQPDKRANKGGLRYIQSPWAQHMFPRHYERVSHPPTSPPLPLALTRSHEQAHQGITDPGPPHPVHTARMGHIPTGHTGLIAKQRLTLHLADPDCHLHPRPQGAKDTA